MGTIKKQNVLLLRCHMQQLHNGLHLSLVVKSTSMQISIELVFLWIVWANWTTFTSPLFIEVPVPSSESERLCNCVLGISSLALSVAFLLDFGIVPTVRIFVSHSIVSTWPHYTMTSILTFHYEMYVSKIYRSGSVIYMNWFSYTTVSLTLWSIY